MPTAPTTIIRRKVEVDFEGVPAGPWFPAGGPLEVLFNAASLAFPPTERFFISAVRDYQDRVIDPQLREQMRGFTHQEAMHNKVHIDCNAMLARHHPHCRHAEEISIGTFRVLGYLPRWYRLSLSSALEHFTSMAADTLLRYPDDFRQIVPQPVADMWLWHAAEETEHKSVCFDVHSAVIGRGTLSYLNRVAGMLLATPLFLFVMLPLGAIVLGWGRHKARVDEVAAIDLTTATDAKRFLGRGIFGLMRELIPWKLYFSYYRPSFHPWDHDNSPLIDEWKQRYPGFGQGSGAAG